MVDIFVGVLVVLVAAAGIWAWWIERNGREKEEDKEKDKEKSPD